MVLATVIAVALSVLQQASPAVAPPVTAPVPATAPAPAPAPAAAPNAAAASAAPAAEEQICRRQPIEGSRRSERVCHTRAEWAALRDHAGGNRDRLSQDQRD